SMLQLSFLLLCSFAAVALSTAGRTAQDCTIGDQWTENFIRFECYQGTGLVVKGVRANGCVPTNKDGGALIQPGTTFDEKYFTYSCSKSGDVVSYQIINCRDSTGEKLVVGETRTMADGSSWKCFKDSTGAIKLSQETQGGCIYDGKVYTTGRSWRQPEDFKVTVAGVVRSIGNAVQMTCRSAGASGYTAQATGCVTTAGKTLSNGGFATVDSLNVKCLIASDGTVTMSVVDESDVTCSFNGTIIKNGEKYTSNNGDVYSCIFGVSSKTSCAFKIGDETHTLNRNSNAYINGKYYSCNSGSGMVDFGQITGCTLPDGSLKNFYSTWTNGTEVNRCRYTVSGATITTYIEIIGCDYNSKTVGRNSLEIIGKDVKKCAFVDGLWRMRNLTTAEYTAYIKSQSTGGSSNVFGGSGGSGSGGDITAKPTTTTTTKPTPTTTKTIVKTSTVVPSTTTRAPVPLTGSPAVVPSRSTLSPTSFITTKDTEAPVTFPITTAPGQCHDLFEMCSTLAPICYDRNNASLSNLNKIIKNMNVTVDQIKEIFKIMGIDK
ncbi:hypothetical protein PFISCL1PPCAC_23699, partial [Pristionchus fissidentatus]